MTSHHTSSPHNRSKFPYHLKSSNAQALPVGSAKAVEEVLGELERPGGARLPVGPQVAEGHDVRLRALGQLRSDGGEMAPDVLATSLTGKRGAYDVTYAPLALWCLPCCLPVVSSPISYSL
jgi:hypothetical protein